MSLKFCNILVTWETTRLLQILLLKLSRRRTMQDSEMSSLPDTLQMPPTGLASTVRVWLRVSRFKADLIIEVLAVWSKFLEQFEYCTLIIWPFTFRTKNVFSCFHDVMTQFKLVKYKLLFSSITLSISSQIKIRFTFICSATFKSQRSQAMHNMWAHRLPHYNQPYCQPRITCCKLAYTKILQNFWLTQVSTESWNNHFQTIFIFFFFFFFC